MTRGLSVIRAIRSRFRCGTAAVTPYVLARARYETDPSVPSLIGYGIMPIDRGIIDNQLQALGEGSRWWDHRELRDLPAVLDADEQILAISRGKIARVRWLRREWLIVVTNRRLLCIRSAGGTSWRQLEVSAGTIGRVALRIGPFHGRVVVVSSGNTFRLLVPRPDAYKLLTALSSLSNFGKEAMSGFGPTLMIRRMFHHVLALPAAALNPEIPGKSPPAGPDVMAIDQRFESLEEQVEELQRQVKFLEQLLRQRHLAASTAEEVRSS